MTSADLSALRIHRDDQDPDRPRRGRRWLIWCVSLIVVLSAGWLAWRGDWLPTAAPMVETARPRMIRAGGAREVLTATGYMVPQLRSVISSRLSGRIAWLGAGEGSRVKAGDVIARLDNDDLAAQVAEARASLAQARAELEQARAAQWEAQREQERQRRLLQEGITTQADDDAATRGLDVATAGLLAAEESVRAAGARLALSEANYDKTIIRAPFDGIVIAKQAEVGEMVAAGAFTGQPTGGAIVTIADFSTLEMEADVNESNLSRIAAGQPALVSVDAVPDRRYRGVLRQIVPAADRQKGVVQAKVRILDPDDRLMPDMSARVEFLTDEIAPEDASAPPRLFVPAGAVRLDGGAAYLLLVKGDTAARVPVTLGESLNGLREVVSGLAGDDQVVVAGGDGLRGGERVRISP